MKARVTFPAAGLYGRSYHPFNKYAFHICDILQYYCKHRCFIKTYGQT